MKASVFFTFLLMFWSSISLARPLSREEFISIIDRPINHPQYTAVFAEDVEIFVKDGGLNSEEGQVAVVKALSFNNFSETQKAAYFALLSFKNRLKPLAIDKLVELAIQNNVSHEGNTISNRFTFPTQLLVHFASYEVAEKLRQATSEKFKEDQRFKN